MKVIKEGEGFSWSHKIQCTTSAIDTKYCIKNKVDPCGSELEIDRDDLRIDTEYNCDSGRTLYHYSVICPVCKCKINIKEHDIPVYIQEYAINKRNPQ